ncbi:alpha/beta hydrolase [Eubacterium callanderi]|uniref:alpha/beta hydrolase n=1 Tax=Eubacterium callanderi TaxID=53442 RepID=UPI001A99044F|nr:alpha/beta hydrolase [Eubacterium callanderi]GFZ24133.1 monoacylglycerol lipase [[Clostridium] methoxybenzovorans]
MRKELTVASFDGMELVMTVDTPEVCKAVVVFVHGLCEHQGRYDYITGKFTARDFKVYRFDHRGHGKSSGDRYFYTNKDEIIDDTNFIVELAKEENPGLPVYVIGHSMGGFAAAAFGTRYPDVVDGIVLSGGLTRDNTGLIINVDMGLDPKTEFPNELGDGVCSDPAVVEAYGKDPLNGKFFTAGLCQSIAEGLRWLMDNRTFSYPVLLLHGEKDALVSPKDTQDFFADIRSEDKQMKIYGNACHEIFNEYIRDEVIEDALAWIEYRLG